MGRHFAGHGFLSAFARYSADERVTGFVRDEATGREFCSFVTGFRPDRAAEFVLQRNVAALKRHGCLYTPAPINAQQAWVRELHGPRSWSLCGVNHTLSSARTMTGITELLTAPVHPWDAVICTSNASKAVIRKLLERQAEYLSRRLGATRFVLPQLPVIPLGVDCGAQSRQVAVRDEARTALGLHSDEVAVLFLGRLSFHAKANPAPMYIALERLAARHRLVLIECGWAANEQISKGFEEARAKLCPSVRSIVLDGRTPEARARAWGAADIFCSLSDNIQETFGLTPIEAMAAGLPVVVTDWDGYRDTVRNGVDGFAVPTLSAPPGTGNSLAVRHALEIDTYDLYIGQASTAVAVDIDATTAAFDRLASDRDLRRRMGANGAARAREVFDWQVIVRAYERLWDELSELRNAAGTAPDASLGGARGFWPARPDPFGLFASFPSATLSGRHRLAQIDGVDEGEVASRLALKVALIHPSGPVSSSFLMELWRRIGSKQPTVRELLEEQPGASAPLTVRGVLWLAKLGLVRILPT